MSFGLATIEIPIHYICTSLSFRVAADLLKWWQNSDIQLPHDPQKVVENDLREMKLLDVELLKAISNAGDRPYKDVIFSWKKHTQQEIVDKNLLQCTAQMPNLPFTKETGKILTFVDSFLEPEVKKYRTEHFRDDSPDRRAHGDFLLRMYDNQDQLVNQATNQLLDQVYIDLVDRDRGPKFLETMLDLVERIFNTQIERLDREAQGTWQRARDDSFKEYDSAISRINELRKQWRPTKQDQINQDCDSALGLAGQAFQAILEQKSRVIAAEGLRRIKLFIGQLKRQLQEWKQRVAQSEVQFRYSAKEEINKADALKIVGVKLFNREEFNDLYEDFLAHKQGISSLCQQLTEQVLEQSNTAWRDVLSDRARFRLLDIGKIPSIQYHDFEKIVLKMSDKSINAAPSGSKLVLDLDACTRFMRLYPNERDRQSRIELLFNRSKPLVRLDPVPPLSSRFSYIDVSQAGLIGGNDTTDPAAQRQVVILKKYFTKEDAIAPLTERERHKILAIHEVGGFSLRCILGINQLRQSYQTWRGQRVKAERDRLQGLSVDNQIGGVHKILLFQQLKKKL